MGSLGRQCTELDSNRMLRQMSNINKYDNQIFRFSDNEMLIKKEIKKCNGTYTMTRGDVHSERMQPY